MISLLNVCDNQSYQVAANSLYNKPLNTDIEFQSKTQGQLQIILTHSGYIMLSRNSGVM